MKSYKICDLILGSNIPLPELLNATGKSPDCTFLLLPPQKQKPPPIDWFHHWQLPSEEIWLSFAKLGCDYLLRFPGLGDFFLSHESREIRCHPASRTPKRTIVHLLLDQVIPLFLNKWGRLVLHGSAVCGPSGAIAFVGVTGAGKSTLTASFVNHGFPLLTDDCLLLEENAGQLLVIPSYPGLRLWDDTISATLNRVKPARCRVAHYTSKKRIGSRNSEFRFCVKPAPLKRMYILANLEETEHATKISIDPISPRDAIVELVKYAFKLDISDREMLRGEFECFARIVPLQLFYHLSVPRDLSRLPAIQEAILKDLESGDN
jgi:hypothetical protein